MAAPVKLRRRARVTAYPMQMKRAAGRNVHSHVEAPAAGTQTRRSAARQQQHDTGSRGTRVATPVTSTQTMKGSIP